MKNYIYILILFITSCSPKILVQQTKEVRSPLSEYAPIGVTERQDIDLSSGILLGNIEIKDNGLTINCDYKTVIDTVKERSRALGGNLVKIDEHKKPGEFGSSCHQIAASVFLVQNPREFEEEICWNKNRRLIIADFQGSIENRPFLASTSSGIYYWIKPLNYGRGFYLSVDAVFKTRLSYFKTGKLDSLLLEHEQLHFDIAEIYARKFFKELSNTQFNLYSYQDEIVVVYDKILEELNAKQDEYDSEVYKNRELQAKWNKWVEKELDKLKEYEKKQMNYSG